MGLDIFITRKNTKTTDQEHVADFRKLNFLIPFFEHDEHDHRTTTIVTKEGFQSLLNICKIILIERNEELSKLLLPTRSGMFFGNTDYNSYYYEDVELTIKKCNDLLDYLDDFPLGETEYLELWTWW